MPTTTISTQITIDAQPDAVWSVLTDFARFGEWNPFMDRAAGSAEVGERLTIHMQPKDGRGMTFKPRVLTSQPGEELRWLGKLGPGGLFDGEHRFALAELPDGRTQLTQEEEFRGILVGVMGSTLTQTETSFHELNAALKARVEDA
jgi:hypothetical protein